MPDGRSVGCARDIAAAVPASIQLWYKFGRAEASGAGHDSPAFPIRCAHHPAFEVGGAHPKGREDHQAVGRARVTVKNDATTLTGGVAQQFESARLAEQAARG